MKAVILAGGLGTRISEETDNKPKPMVEIGGKPILWHIFKIYSHYGINDFIVCCGYKGYVIKEYLANYFLHNSNITIDMQANNIKVHEKNIEPWKITIVDTGLNTMTGGRLKRIKNYLEKEKSFCLTYGDGLANINIDELIKFHKKNQKIATLTAVYPPTRFGILDINQDSIVTSFKEKPDNKKTMINGGYFVFNSEIFDYIKDDNTILEAYPLQKLSKEGELAAFKHEGFWQPMDTLRDKKNLEAQWENKNPLWKIW